MDNIHNAMANQIELLNEITPDVPGETVGAVDLCDQIEINKKILSVFHINIRSVRENFNNLVSFLESFKIYFCDVIVLSECFRLDSFAEFSMQGFTTYYNYGQINKNDGVLTMVKTSLGASVTTHTLRSTKINVSKISFDINNITYGISTIYRSPATSKKDFITDLDLYLENNLTKNIEIIVGDLNFDLLNASDADAVGYYTTLVSYGLQPYINSVTREQSGACLDHIFVKTNLNIESMSFSSYIVSHDITDHYPIVLNISDHSGNNLPVKATNKIIKVNKNKLHGLLKTEYWNEILNANEPELAYQTFLNKFQNYYSLCKIVKTQKVFKKIKPWITQGLIISIKKRDGLKKQLQRHYTEEKYIEYKSYRNALKKLIDNTKNQYYKTKIEQNKNNPKKIYKFIAEATNQGKKTSESLNIVNNENEPFINDLDMSNYCNKYFSNIAIEMNNKIPHTLEQFNLTSINKSMFLKPVTQNELIQHINSLKSNSAPGCDKITVETIKEFHNYLLEPLTHIFNLIYKTGIVPSSLKRSIITPIYKSGKHNLISNYRPISLINNFAKLFEKTLKSRLLNFTKLHNIMSENQFGFTEGLSTNDAMCCLIKEATNIINKNKTCMVVFLDLAKAFDTVSHKILLDVLERNGVRGNVWRVFESYLAGRQQQVRIRETMSDPHTINIGVPQGTVLGPILFNLYINSIKDIEIEGKIVSYADDTAIIFSGYSWEETRINAINGLRKIKTWLNVHKLSLNIKKTNYLAITKVDLNRPPFNHIEIGENEKIEEVPQVKYLGVMIDCYLKWGAHAEYLTKKIRSLSYKFYILRNILSTSMLIALYRSLVESLLTYGITVWGSMYENAMRPLQIVQNKILKIIHKKDRLYPTNMLYNEKILDLRTLFFHSVNCYIHKHSRAQPGVTHSQNTRFRLNRLLKIPICNSEFYRRSINYLGPKIYNLLPTEMKNVVKLKLFSKKTKAFVWERRILFKNLL